MRAISEEEEDDDYDNDGDGPPKELCTIVHDDDYHTLTDMRGLSAHIYSNILTQQGLGLRRTTY